LLSQRNRHFSVSCSEPAVINHLLQLGFYDFDFFPADSFQFSFQRHIQFRFLGHDHFFRSIISPRCGSLGFEFISVYICLIMVTDWHMPAGESNVCCGEVAGLAHE
jgi:hypothetical protein